ncbi:MAG: hypothetical protein NC548_64205 [Lachnospiraceae bacterium]|nr:hypothetical protein [Lachnospiraceae bacterium]
MKSYVFILILLILSACSGPTFPSYEYTYNHKLDEELKKCNFCLHIDNSKTTYKKGHQNLSMNPFLGQEGYSASNVNKYTKEYEQEYFNDRCENPISLQRKIEVSSISFQDICYGSSYAGSVYTGATTRYYGNMATTHIHTVPVYNTTAYQCVRTLYLTNIDFYNGKKNVGNIKSEFWSEYRNIDEVVRRFTSEFLLNVKNDIKNDRRREKVKDSCNDCYKEDTGFWRSIGCIISCDNIIDDNK